MSKYKIEQLIPGVALWQITTLKGTVICTVESVERAENMVKLMELGESMLNVKLEWD